MNNRIYTRKGIVQNETYGNPELPQLRRFKISLLDNPQSEIRVTIPVTATKTDIERAIAHMETEMERWEA